MDQTVQSNQPPVPVPPPAPPKKFSGYKIAGLVLGVVAIVVIAGAFLAPNFVKSLVGLNPETTATQTPIISTTATKTSSPSLSATAAQSGTASATKTSQSGSDQTTATSGADTGGATGTASCTVDDFNLDESQCSSQTPEKVCGVIRYVYDNGEEATRSTSFLNVCEYCSQFDASGFLELRGTKMYSKGYSMGQCQ